MVQNFFIFIKLIVLIDFEGLHYDVFSMGMMQIMGCKSYSEFSTRTNLAGSSDVVMSFLIELSKIVRKKADEVKMGNSSVPFVLIVFLSPVLFSSEGIHGHQKLQDTNVW